MTALTPEACRAARALLGWGVRDLAREAGISPNTVHLVEKGSPFRADTATKITDALGRFNVEITNGDGTGARLRSVS